MKKELKFFVVLFGMMLSGEAFAVSLDSVYRDVVRSTHDGYLPVFVKNRETPTLDIDETKFDTSYSEDEKVYEIEKLDFSKDARMKKLAAIRAHDEWLRTIESIEMRNVTPVDLERVEQRVAQNEPRAVEIYAWMFAKGVGVEKNLVKSFRLYRHAEELHVEKAKENALKVYEVMTQEQKKKVLYN
ncbi:MAG: hypothetical protein PHE89_01235 [Alphaproteobacteria bacterium]|nr:hypothetical protein [Alphaproteobacteria bacterium]